MDKNMIEFYNIPKWIHVGNWIVPHAKHISDINTRIQFDDLTKIIEIDVNSTPIKVTLAIDKEIYKIDIDFIKRHGAPVEFCPYTTAKDLDELVGKTLTITEADGTVKTEVISEVRYDDHKIYVKINGKDEMTLRKLNAEIDGYPIGIPYINTNYVY
jgi:hypothetical protein